MSNRTFIIPAVNRKAVEAQLEKLNKRAIKLGLGGIELDWGKAVFSAITLKGKTKDVLAFPVRVYGPLYIQFEGWEFLATLQHLPTGENIVRGIHSDYPVPEKYKTCPSNCEHCKVNRYRKDTYLVQHIDQKNVIQVGSSCIKEFLGGNSPDNILSKVNFAAETLQFLTGASEDYQDDEDESKSNYYFIIKFLAHTSAVIRKHGWVSKTAASQDNKKSTVSWVQESLSYSGNITQEDNSLATEAAEWAENLSDEDCNQSDYLHNIRAIVRSGMVEKRTMGFAASIMAAYNKEASKKKLKVSNFIGQLNSKINVDGILKFSFTSNYDSNKVKYIFHDLNGNVIVWNTSFHNLEVNKQYNIRGTVKEHTVYKNIKQTVLTRCEIR